jgi:hypothetical protein
MLGDSVTLLAYLGGLTVVIDRFVASGRLGRPELQEPEPPASPAAVPQWQGQAFSSSGPLSPRR